MDIMAENRTLFSELLLTPSCCDTQCQNLTRHYLTTTNYSFTRGCRSIFSSEGASEDLAWSLEFILVLLRSR